ncbi:hypothetical protein DFH06DRAFT_1141865 [Mycena polygramma]|nr:hypothetical protein DFH06DRAFT_1141865 [Mycena polygramma]
MAIEPFLGGQGEGGLGSRLKKLFDRISEFRKLIPPCVSHPSSNYSSLRNLGRRLFFLFSVVFGRTAAPPPILTGLPQDIARWNRAANPQLPISTTLHFDAIIKFSPKKSRSKQDSCSMVKTIPMGLSFFEYALCVTVAEYNILPLNRWHCEEKSEHVSFGLILARLPVSCRTTVFFGSNFNDGIKLPSHGYEQLRIRSAIPTRVTPKESDQN